MTDEPQNIRGLFLSAESTREQLQSSYEPNSLTFQENLNAAIATYTECLKLTDQVSLFSSNEALEDVSSADLQYVTRSLWKTPRSLLGRALGSN